MFLSPAILLVQVVFKTSSMRTYVPWKGGCSSNRLVHTALFQPGLSPWCADSADVTSVMRANDPQATITASSSMELKPLIRPKGSVNERDSHPRPRALPCARLLVTSPELKPDAGFVRVPGCGLATSGLRVEDCTTTPDRGSGSVWYTLSKAAKHIAKQSTDSTNPASRLRTWGRSWPRILRKARSSQRLER